MFILKKLCAIPCVPLLRATFGGSPSLNLNKVQTILQIRKYRSGNTFSQLMHEQKGMLFRQTQQLIYSHVEFSTSIKDWWGKVKSGQKPCWPSQEACGNHIYYVSLILSYVISC